jgi:hypothetical protein
MVPEQRDVASPDLARTAEDPSLDTFSGSIPCLLLKMNPRMTRSACTA